MALVTHLRTLAPEDAPGQDLVLGSGQFLGGHPVGVDGPVDLGHPGEVGLGLLGLAAHEGEDHPGPVVILVADLRAVGEAGVDQAPVEPAAGVIAEDRR